MNPIHRVLLFSWLAAAALASIAQAQTSYEGQSDTWSEEYEFTIFVFPPGGSETVETRCRILETWQYRNIFLDTDPLNPSVEFEVWISRTAISGDSLCPPSDPLFSFFQKVQNVSVTDTDIIGSDLEGSTSPVPLTLAWSFSTDKSLVTGTIEWLGGTSNDIGQIVYLNNVELVIAEPRQPTVVLVEPCVDDSFLTCAIGITGLRIGGETYDVEFVLESYNSTYADAPPLFLSNRANLEPINAISDALNDVPGNFGVVGRGTIQSQIQVPWNDAGGELASVIVSFCFPLDANGCGVWAPRFAIVVSKEIVTGGPDIYGPYARFELSAGQNTPPVADAGMDQGAIIGNMVSLDGSASNDANFDVLSFGWVLTDKPATSAAFLNGDNTVSPFFVPDLPGIYVAQLVVNDGLADSIPSEVTITAVTLEAFAEMNAMEAINVIAAIPPGNFRKKGDQKSFSKRISKVIKELQKGNDKAMKALQKGDIAKAEKERAKATKKATKELSKSIERTDGCALRGAPDIGGGKGGPQPKKDDITDCPSQALVYPLLVEALAALTP